jgi:hypothetical protein
VLIVTLIDVAAVVAAMAAAMVAAAVHVAIYLMMVVVVAPSDPAQWVSVGTIGVPLVAVQREWLLHLVVVGGLLDQH